MLEADWFEITEGEDLLQGDILLKCPIFLPSGSFRWPLPPNEDLHMQICLLDLAILTQSCDLENNKVQDVLLAAIIAWPDVVRDEVSKGNELVRSSKFRKLLVDGNIPGLSLLHKRDQVPSLEWSIVDFHQLYTLPKTLLRPFARAAGPRLRLRSPYREHLAQDFARYFMRIGLPHDARSFEKEGDLKV